MSSELEAESSVAPAGDGHGREFGCTSTTSPRTPSRHWHERGEGPALAPDLEAGLRRLKLAAMRHVAPELLVTAKTRRRTPEEFLRTLVEAEITSRDSSMTAQRLKAATFPVVKMFDEFDVAAVHAGFKVRYLTAADLIDTLYRGLADNSVGKVIDTLLRGDVIICDEMASRPWTTPAPSCCSGSSQPPTNAGPSRWHRTGRSTNGDGSCPSTPPP